MLTAVQTINAYLSDYVLVFLLVAVGLWDTLKTRFVQVRCLGEGLKGVFGGMSLNGGKHGGGMSSFQALATAIAARVGTGAIVGCSGAIGATFETAFGIPAWAVGIVLVVICGFIFLGGVDRLASVTEKLVPIMAFAFLVGSLMVVIARIQYIPQAFGMIFRYAFAPQAIIGGGIGSALKIAVSQGAKRGLFANEAGMGSTPHAHALAKVSSPHEQGVVAMVGVFLDTYVILTLNALVVICTLYTPDGPLANGYSGAITQTLNKANLAQTAFDVVFGEGIGAMFVAATLFFFAFSTILGWNLFAKINVVYLFGNKGVKAFTVMALGFIFLGTLASNDLVWELSDLCNQLMVIPNGAALFALTGMVMTSLKENHDDPVETELGLQWGPGAPTAENAGFGGRSKPRFCAGGGHLCGQLMPHGLKF